MKVGLISVTEPILVCTKDLISWEARPFYNAL